MPVELRQPILVLLLQQPMPNLVWCEKAAEARSVLVESPK